MFIIYFTLTSLLLRKNRQTWVAKPAIIIVVAATVAMIASASASMASAKCPVSLNTATGTIASIQNGKNGKPEWILSGAWDFKNMNTNSPTFNSTFNMAMLNGSEPHMHTIKDFKLSVSAGHASTSQGNLTKAATKYNGTATVIMKGTPISNVPISINLMGHVMSLWIDPTKVMNHFGNTPIYGFVTC
jgi:hypothetical protein